MKHFKSEEELNYYLTHETKGERIAKNLGGVFRNALFTPLSVLCGFLSVACHIIGKLSSVLMIAGFYYAYKTWKLVQNGGSLFEHGYFKLSVSFLIFPFIAILVSVGFAALRDFFRSRVD